MSRRGQARHTARCASARWLTVVLALCAGVASGCSPRRELTAAFDSPEALARAVLESVARRDRAALERLALSEAEFRGVIWPELPAARPERNLPPDYVWRDLRQKSQASLSEVLARYGGRRYTLERIAFRSGSSRYRSFEVNRDTELVVRDESGAVERIRLFGSLLERAGRHKVFSFVID